MYLFRKFIVAMVISFCLTAISSAQTGYRPKNEFGEPRFAIEAVAFRGQNEGEITVEVYYKIFYDALSYQKNDSGFTADYEVALSVEGDDDIALDGASRSGQIYVKSYAETRRATDFVINKSSFTFESDDDLTIRAILTDKVAGQPIDLKIKLKDHDFWGKYPSLSGVEFAREVGPAQNKSKFNRGEYRIIPSVTRLFGGDMDSMLTYYQEVYPGTSQDKQLHLINEIRSRTKGIVYTDTVAYGEIFATQQLVHSIPVYNIAPGDYDLVMRLEGRRGRLFEKLEESFELELTAETIYRNDYDLAVDMLKYLATGEERKRLESAKTPEERRRAWDEFWKLRDNDIHDAENPTKLEYFRRIRHANRNFSVMKRPGWKTSRGMIYITYGEPDEVEDYPFELSSKPYQIWNYYRINPARQFLFVDEWGDGNYRLQPPYDGISY